MLQKDPKKVFLKEFSLRFYRIPNYHKGWYDGQPYERLSLQNINIHRQNL